MAEKLRSRGVQRGTEVRSSKGIQEPGMSAQQKTIDLSSSAGEWQTNFSKCDIESLRLQIIPYLLLQLDSELDSTKHSDAHSVLKCRITFLKIE